MTSFEQGAERRRVRRPALPWMWSRSLGNSVRTCWSRSAAKRGERYSRRSGSRTRPMPSKPASRVWRTRQPPGRSVSSRRSRAGRRTRRPNRQTILRPGSASTTTADSRSRRLPTYSSIRTTSPTGPSAASTTWNCKWVPGHHARYRSSEGCSRKSVTSCAVIPSTKTDDSITSIGVRHPCWKRERARCSQWMLARFWSAADLCLIACSNCRVARVSAGAAVHTRGDGPRSGRSCDNRL